MYSRIFVISAILLTSSVYANTPKSITLNVQNMTCGLCPVTIKKALENTVGVTKVQIEFDKKTAVVSYDAEKVGVAKLVSATTNAGFPSTPREAK